MKSGDVIKLSEECKRALAENNMARNTAYQAFIMAVQMLEDCHKRATIIVREHHPELAEHEFITHYDRGKVTVAYHRAMLDELSHQGMIPVQ